MFIFLSELASRKYTMLNDLMMMMPVNLGRYSSELIAY